MLPLLPALILLLLNGPANIERLAEGGALPAAIAAVQQKVAAAPNSNFAQARADQLALASLLSLSGDPQLSKALAHIFAMHVDCDVQPSVQPDGLVQEEKGNEPPPIARSIGDTREGFLNSQRSRDGPLSR